LIYTSNNQEILMSASKIKNVAQVAWALADPLRLSILQHLMGGPAVVAELVSVLGESQSKVSNHLKVLREQGLVGSERWGRQSIYEISDASVAQLIESLTMVAGGPMTSSLRTDPLAKARTCYDHLAGELGVSLFGALVEAEAIRPTADIRGDVEPGRAAKETFGSLGVDLEEVEWDRGRRRFAVACPDWTERQPHLGGALGAAVCRRFFEEGWVERDRETRAVRLTNEGRYALVKRLGLVSENTGTERGQ
jgi:DNA-binding transcriptional ArsR family regulator